MEFSRVEEELMVQCLRFRTNPDRGVRIKELAAQPLNWNYFFSLAIRHRVKPLIFLALVDSNSSDVPASILADLQNQSRLNLITNMQLKQELLRILDIFADNNINSIPFKGPVLAELVYHDLSLRPSGDLDILIHKGNVLRAHNLLLESGYVSFDSPEEQAKRLKQHYHLSVYHRVTNLRVELHWALARKDMFQLANPALFWDNSSSVVFGGKSVTLAAPEDLLIFICTHGFKHQWSSLLWLYDVGEILRSYPEIRWEMIFANAEKLRGKGIVLLSLLLVNEMFDCMLPARVTDEIAAHPTIQGYASKLEKSLVKIDDTLPLDDFLFQYSLRESWNARVQYISSKLVPNSNEHDLPVARRLGFLLPPIRLTRLVIQYFLPWLKLQVTSLSIKRIREHIGNPHPDNRVE